MPPGCFAIYVNGQESESRPSQLNWLNFVCFVIDTTNKRLFLGCKKRTIFRQSFNEAMIFGFPAMGSRMYKAMRPQ